MSLIYRMHVFAKKYPKTAKAIQYVGNTARIAHQAYNMARVVASIVNSEKKYHDVGNTWEHDTTANITCLTNMEQGDTKILRNGDTIALKSLQFEAFVNRDVDEKFETVKIALVEAIDNLEGTPPTWTDVYETSSPLSFREKDKPKRFKVLKEWVLPHTEDKAVRHLEYYHKFPMMKDRRGNPTVSHKVTFDGGNANEYCRNHIFLMMLGNVATAETLSSINWISRIRYYDN